MKTSPAKWIVQTALFVAILIIFQSLSAPLGQLVTGSLVNFVLIAATVLIDTKSGIVVAAISPIFAFLLGIGPKLPPLIPFIILGNLVLVVIWHLIIKKTPIKNQWLQYGTAAVIGAVCKFFVLFLTVTKCLLPYFLQLPAPQTKLITTMFSVPQLITALIGGIAATILLPMLQRVKK